MQEHPYMDDRKSSGDNDGDDYDDDDDDDDDDDHIHDHHADDNDSHWLHAGGFTPWQQLR